MNSVTVEEFCKDLSDIQKVIQILEMEHYIYETKQSISRWCWKVRLDK